MIYNNKNKEFELVELIKKNDSRAMKELYCRYIGYLTAVCSRYIICEDNLRDILQDSFIKIFTSIENFEYRGAGSLKAWMTKIVVNEALKSFKKDIKFDFVQVEWELPDVSAEEEEPEIEDLPPEVIQKLIRQLPEGYRTVFNLYVFENKSHKEIATILGIKENTSASQFHKAKKMLAQKINEYKKA